MTERLQRFLVRRKTKEVFIWTEALVKGYPELEEVVAASAGDALLARTLPDPRRISLLEIESMTKQDLVLFGKLKLDIELDAGKSRKQLIFDVKEAIFTRPIEGETAEEVTVDMTQAKAGQAVSKSVPMPTPKKARASPGM